MHHPVILMWHLIDKVEHHDSSSHNNFTQGVVYVL